MITVIDWTHILKCFYLFIFLQDISWTVQNLNPQWSFIFSRQMAGEKFRSVMTHQFWIFHTEATEASQMACWCRGIFWFTLNIQAGECHKNKCAVSKRAKHSRGRGWSCVEVTVWSRLFCFFSHFQQNCTTMAVWWFVKWHSMWTCLQKLQKVSLPPSKLPVWLLVMLVVRLFLGPFCPVKPTHNSVSDR